MVGGCDSMPPIPTHWSPSSSTEQRSTEATRPRERDLRRDTALAAPGWVVLRFSYARLMADPEGCRREIEAVVQGRMAGR